MNYTVIFITETMEKIEFIIKIIHWLEVCFYKIQRKCNKNLIKDGNMNIPRLKESIMSLGVFF